MALRLCSNEKQNIHIFLWKKCWNNVLGNILSRKSSLKKKKRSRSKQSSLNHSNFSNILGFFILWYRFCFDKGISLKVHSFHFRPSISSIYFEFSVETDRNHYWIMTFPLKVFNTSFKTSQIYQHSMNIIYTYSTRWETYDPLTPDFSTITNPVYNNKFWKCF